MDEIMTISDDDFMHFYQYPISMLVIEGDSHMYGMAGGPEGGDEWYEKAIAALTRIGLSGLMYCWEEGDLTPALRDMFIDRSDDNWGSYIFNPTEACMELGRKFNLEDEGELHSRLLLGFREELGRIFEEHGVGLDIDLPYDKLFSLESD